MSWLASLLISGLMTAGFAGSGQTVQPPAHTSQVHHNTHIAAEVPPATGEESERFEQVYPFNANGVVALSNLNGAVVIDAWDRNEVRVEYTKTASDKEVLSWAEVRINASKEQIKIEANYDNWKNKQNGDWESWKDRKLAVNFKLTVPRTAILNEIETINGSVTVSNIAAACKVSTVNGPVTAKNLRGDATLSTVNGVVHADFDRLEKGTKISLTAVNGRASIVIPSDSDATVTADTLNGPIANDLGLPVSKGQYVGRNLHGRLGNGDVKIKLSSVNGSLAVTRKQDGKMLSPATNLLPLRKAGEENDTQVDVDARVAADVRISTDRINREVERAVRDAGRAAVEVNTPANEAARAATRDALRYADEIQRDVTKSAMATSTAALKANVKALDKMNQALARTNLQSNLNYDLSTFANAPAMAKKSETFPVKGIPKVIVDAKNCAVIVRGWDRQEVQYSLTTVSRSGSRAEDSTVDVEHDESKVKIKIANNTLANRYRLEVFVPKKANLKIFSDKEIRLDGVAGQLDLSAVNDSINVRDSEGMLTIGSIGGNIRVIGFAGEVNATTAKGVASFEGEFTKFAANAGEGTIVLMVPGDSGILIPGSVEQVTAEGFAIVKEDSKWKIGNGGETYRISANPRGRIIVRNADKLKATAIAGIAGGRN